MDALLSSAADAADAALAKAGFDRGPWLAIAFAGGIAAWFVLDDAAHWVGFGSLCLLFAVGAVALWRGEERRAHLLTAVVAIGLLAASPEYGIAAAIVEQSPAGEMLRRLLPGIVVLPLVIGWFAHQAESATYYDSAATLAIFAVASILVLALFAWTTIGAVRRCARGSVSASSAMPPSVKLAPCGWSLTVSVIDIEPSAGQNHTPGVDLFHEAEVVGGDHHRRAQPVELDE